MKIQIKKGHYTFNAAAKTVTFNDYTAIELDSILLITNVKAITNELTNGTIIYNFAVAALHGSVNNNTLTLNYDTSLMHDTDDLQIYYDDNDVPSTEANQEILNALIQMVQSQIDNDDILKRQLMQLLKPLSVITSGSFRLNIDVNNITALPTLANVTTVATVSTITNTVPVGTVANHSNVGGLNALDLQVNNARLAYAHAIRSNLTF